MKRRDFNDKIYIYYIYTLAKINWEKYFSTNFIFHLLHKVHGYFKTVSLKKTVKIGYKNRLPYLTAALQKSIKTKHILKHAYEKILP